MGLHNPQPLYPVGTPFTQLIVPTGDIFGPADTTYGLRSGLYRFSGMLWCSTVNTGADTAALFVGFQNPVGTLSQINSPGILLNAVGVFTQLTCTFRHVAGDAVIITWGTTDSGTDDLYQAYVYVEPLVFG